MRAGKRTDGAVANKESDVTDRGQGAVVVTAEGRPLNSEQELIGNDDPVVHGEPAVVGEEDQSTTEPVEEDVEVEKDEVVLSNENFDATETEDAVVGHMFVPEIMDENAEETGDTSAPEDLGEQNDDATEKVDNMFVPEGPGKPNFEIVDENAEKTGDTSAPEDFGEQSADTTESVEETPVRVDTLDETVKDAERETFGPMEPVVVECLQTPESDDLLDQTGVLQNW